MKLKGIITNSNQYKDSDAIVDLICSNKTYTFRAKGIRKANAKNKSLVMDLAYINGEFVQTGDKLTLINGENLLNLNNFYASFSGLIFINLFKEILYKAVIEEDRHLVYTKLEIALRSIESASKDRLDNITYSWLIVIILEILNIAGYDAEAYFKEDKFLKVIKFFKRNDFSNNFEDKNLIFTLKKLIKYFEDVNDIEIHSKELIKHF